MNIIEEVIQPSDTEKAEPQNKKMLLRIILIIIPIIFMAVICVFGVIAAIISGFMLSSAYDTRAREAAELIDNRTIYVTEFDGDITDIKYYSFNDGYVSEEIHHLDGENPENNSVSGDITDYNKMYRIDASRFSNKIAVYSSTDGKAWELIIKRRIAHSEFSDWHFIDMEYNSIDDIISTRNKILEDKNFNDNGSEATTPSEKYNTFIPKELIADAVNSYVYYLEQSSELFSFSVSVGEVIDRCCEDYIFYYSPYYETKYDYIASESIEEIENGPYAEYLDNSFIINVSGKILYNPEIPGYYTENQDIINLLVHFDENNNNVDMARMYTSEEFHRCAVKIALEDFDF